MQKLLLILFVLLFATAGSRAQTIVQRHGQLTVDGNRIKDECGRVTQLKGMSYFWSQWEGKEYYNANAIKWLRDDWKVEIVRAAIAVRGEDDYITDPTTHYNRAVAVIDGAVQHGIYAIADFHAHDADQYTTQAKTLFRQLSARYKDTPNIIYEIWNEPIGGGDDASSRATWTRIKNYAREVISVIRDNDPDGLIVVGTPFYSQRVDIATESPLTTDSKGRPVGNLAYTIHAYVGTHGADLRAKGDVALGRGYALFMTECGRTDASANGPVYPANWDTWESWMDARGISYAKWSLSSKNETCSSLQPGAPANGGWTTAQLRPEGQWNRTHFRSVNATQPSVCGTTTPPPPTSSPTTNRNIYTDNFNNTWANWSWGGTAVDQDGGIKKNGSYSFKYDFNAGGAVSFRHPSGLPSDNLVRLEFWARAYTGSATFQVSGSYDDTYENRGSTTNATITTTWQKFSFTKAQLGNYNWYRRFFLFNGSTGVAVFLDDVRLVYNTSASQILGGLSTETTTALDRTGILEVFPNPTHGTFTLTVNLAEAVPQLNVAVTDIAGRMVLQQRQDAFLGQNRFDLTLPSGSATGIYLARVYDNSGSIQFTQRLLLE